jgi:hypothetical protein
LRFSTRFRQDKIALVGVDPSRTRDNQNEKRFKDDHLKSLGKVFAFLITAMGRGLEVLTGAVLRRFQKWAFSINRIAFAF